MEVGMDDKHDHGGGYRPKLIDPHDLKSKDAMSPNGFKGYSGGSIMKKKALGSTPLRGPKKQEGWKDRG